MKTSEYTNTPIHIPAPLRSYTGGQSIINVNGGSVEEALNDLVHQFPALKQHLFNEEGTLRTFVNIYLNDDDIRYLRQTSTELSEDDELTIVPSIAGGCPAVSFGYGSTLTTRDHRGLCGSIQFRTLEERMYRRIPEFSDQKTTPES